jgi:hypothetical protein
MRLLLGLLLAGAAAAFHPLPASAATVCIPDSEPCVDVEALPPCATFRLAPDNSGGACVEDGSVIVWRCTFINCQAVRVPLPVEP